MESYRYLRFNVEQGLQDVGLSEYKERGRIETVTDEYLSSSKLKQSRDACAKNLSKKQASTNLDVASRLQEQYLQRNTEAVKTCLDIHETIPHERNQNFVGRTKELNEIEKRLFLPEQCSKVAIYGLGGIGKTQIAIETAYRTKQNDPDCLIFWVRADSQESFRQSYLHIGKTLRIPRIEDQKADTLSPVLDRLNSRNTSRWLLILDNADDLNLWSSTSNTNSPPLIKYLPRSPLGSILITTRDKKVASRLAYGNLVEVEAMDKDIAIELMRTLIDDEHLLSDNDDFTGKILELLAFLPLAISQAAAYINENEVSLQDYISLLEDTEEDQVAILSEDFDGPGRDGRYDNAVAKTWLISFENIKKRNQFAADCLSIMAFYEPQNVPTKLLPRAETKTLFFNAVGILKAFGFVTERFDSGILDVHRLVQLATRKWLKLKGIFKEMKIEAMVLLASTFVSNYRNNSMVDPCRIIYPHFEES